MQSVSILIVGDEILSGEIADENGPYLMGRLGAAGIRAVRHVTVPDAEAPIVEELARLRALSDAVVVSGGLGPTHDDVTRPAVARALGVLLEVLPEAEARIRAFYGDRVTDAELSMARMPAGARLVDGVETGTFGFELAGVYALPGVPFLFRDLIEGLAPRFRAAPLHKAELRSERREGELAGVLASVQGAAADVAIGSYPVCEDGCWHVRIVLRGLDPARVSAVADEIRPQVV